MAKSQTHRGRPTTAATPGKKSTLGIRVTAEVKTQLDHAAKANDRPLSQEAELRLERSFHAEGLLTEVLTLAYGRDLAGLLMGLAQVMEGAGQARAYRFMGPAAAQQWLSDPNGFDTALQGATAFLEGLRPAGELREIPSAQDMGAEMSKADMEHEDKIERELPTIMAEALLDAIAGEPNREPCWPRDHTPEIRQLLRQVAARAAEGKRANPEGAMNHMVQAMKAMPKSRPGKPAPKTGSRAKAMEGRNDG